MKKTSLLLLAVGGLSASAQAAVSLPYFNDFSATPVPLTEITDAAWALNTATGFLVNDGTVTTSATFIANTSVTRSAYESWTMSTTFALGSTATSTAYSLGFEALGSASGTTANYYLADITQAGVLRLYPVAGGNAGTAYTLATSGTSVGALASAGTVTLTLTGTYDALNQLTLSLTATNGSNTQTASNTTPISSPSTGTYFGLRTRNSLTNSSFLVNYDTFSIIPEPSSVMLLGLGASVAISRRRRA